MSAFTYESTQTPPNPLRTIWRNADATQIMVINQTVLPHEMRIETLKDVKQVYEAIHFMIVRGAPLIGATAAYGVYFAFKYAAENNKSKDFVQEQIDYLRNSRPTAVNLFWAIDKVLQATEKGESLAEKAKLALEAADWIVSEDIETCRQIGVHGLPILQELAEKKAGKTINILTHCNAGMLGCIQWGTITSPIYQAKALGIAIHVWVDETRPRNQGANLTAWELTQHGIPHTLIVDNTGGILMQNGMVDLVLVGTDRTTRRGDVANKIGTYLKALAAADNNVPFFVALPSTSIDWNISDGLTEIPIEKRNADEVRYVQGKTKAGSIENVLICPETTDALNYGFDVTPSRLVTGGLITERGICRADENDLLRLFPEKSK